MEDLPWFQELGKGLIGTGIILDMLDVVTIIVSADGVDGNDPLLIRNFSGAMNEFCLCGQALEAAEE